MIRDFLGEPDKRQNRAQYRGTVYRLYAKARVEAAEQLDDFKVWMERLKKRRAAAPEKAAKKRYAEKVAAIEQSQHWDLTETSEELLLFTAKVKHCGCKWEAGFSPEGDAWRPACHTVASEGHVNIASWRDSEKHSRICRYRQGEPIFRPAFHTEHNLWCAMDFEIADPEKEHGSVCAVGVAVFDSAGDYVEGKSWKVRPPGNKYDPAVVRAIGLKPSDTETADPWDVVSRKIDKTVGEMPIVFHASENEMRQIFAYENCWRPEEDQVFCSQRMAHFFFPESSMGLVSLCGERLIPVTGHHDPLCDAQAAGWLWQSLAGEIGEDERDSFAYFRDSAKLLPERWMFKGLPATAGQLDYLDIIHHETCISPKTETSESLKKRLQTLSERQKESPNDDRQRLIEKLDRKLADMEPDGGAVSWHGVDLSVKPPPDSEKVSASYVLGEMSRGEAARVLDKAVPVFRRHQERNRKDYYEEEWHY